MLAYWISGEGYNQILVSVNKGRSTPVVEQYYVQFGNIVHRSKVIYSLGYENGVYLKHIDTEDTDTVILPKGLFKRVGPYAISGCEFRRLVVPLKMEVEFVSKSLWGSDTLCEFLSLSRDVEYAQDVFPATVIKRRF